MSKKADYILHAIADFATIPRPSSDQSTRLKDLICGYIDNLNNDQLREICAALSTCDQAPKSLILKLCELPSHICQSLLINNVRLGAADFKAIIEDNESLDKARVIARNSSVDDEITSDLRLLKDPKIDRSLDLRQRPTKKESVFPPYYPPPEATMDATALLDCCGDENDAVIHTALADALGLSVTSVSILSSDATSRNLLTALHFLRLSVDDAWLIYTRLTAEFENDKGVEIAFRTVYDSLDRNETTIIVNQWQVEELLSLLRTNNPANDQMDSDLRKSA